MEANWRRKGNVKSQPCCVCNINNMFYRPADQHIVRKCAIVLLSLNDAIADVFE